MTVQTPPWAIQGSSHPAEVGRSAMAAMFGVPVATHTVGSSIATAGGGHGVVDAPDLAVTQNGTPNMSVNVAAGRAVIRAGHAGNLTGGVYVFLNDATVNLSIAAADATNPRRDLIIAQVRDTNYGEAASEARLLVVTGTPAASPSDPSLTSYPNCLVLARVAVAASDTAINTGDITDLRTRAHATGGLWIGTSAVRPTGASLHEGKAGIDTTNDRFTVVDGSNVEQRVGHYSSAGRTGGRWRRVANQSVAGTSTYVEISWDTEDADSDAFLVPHATTGTTITIPAGLGGVYAILASLTWAASPGANSVIEILVNSAIPYRFLVGSSTPMQVCAASVPGVHLAAGDTIKVRAYQGSGGSINVTGHLQILRLAI